MDWKWERNEAYHTPHLETFLEFLVVPHTHTALSHSFPRSLAICLFVFVNSGTLFNVHRREKLYARTHRRVRVLSQ